MIGLGVKVIGLGVKVIGDRLWVNDDVSTWFFI